MSHDMTRRAAMTTILGVAGLAAGPASARAPTARDRLAADRQAILAMAGDFRVRFDFRETVSFRPDYTPLEPKVSTGNEVVRVIAETPEMISLQHILIVERGDKAELVKHWRQDWQYEPRSVLTYVRKNRWHLRKIDREDRTGAWSQTVWQTDDSPRYGGMGRWCHDFGVSIWQSEKTLRPLARRDAIRQPPYDHYIGINRHALTPTGWVHEQDNAKRASGSGSAYVHEVVLNSYTRTSDYSPAPADDYWRASSLYWAGVRAAWADAIARGQGLSLAEEPENGSVTGARLMALADEVAAGTRTTHAAIEEAAALILRETTADRSASVASGDER